MHDARTMLPITEVAARLGVSLAVVRRLIRHGRLTAVMIGREFRVAPSELERVCCEGAALSPRRALAARSGGGPQF